MNKELRSLYGADKQERVNQPKINTIEYKAMRARDSERREHVMKLFAANELHRAEDNFHAAHIMNHGDTIDDAKNAHVLAIRSSELGYRPARWLAAASYDRWQMYQGKPQKYGTNYVYDGREDRLWDVDPETTDEERAKWNVPRWPSNSAKHGRQTSIKFPYLRWNKGSLNRRPPSGLNRH